MTGDDSTRRVTGEKINTKCTTRRVSSLLIMINLRFPGALPCSALSVLMDITFPLVINGEKLRLENTHLNLVVRGLHMWECSISLQVQGYTAALKRTGLKASLEMFITVWVFCMQTSPSLYLYLYLSLSLPLYVSSKIP